MPVLGLNIDHVASLREARRGEEPDPAWAAVEGQLAGAGCLTLHLREDRRHVRDHDVERVRSVCSVKLNLECAATEEMLAIAGRVRPEMATLVPEGRAEITTEGGLEVAREPGRFAEAVRALHEHGVAASAFVDADPEQVEAAAEAGFDFCEIHTGPYAHASAARDGRPDAELARVAEAGARVRERGMRLNAGHALNLANAGRVAALEGVEELHIGHAIIARAVFVGLQGAVREMRDRIE